MTRLWYTDLRSGAGRFARMDAARTVLNRPDLPLIARAAAFALVVTLTLVALLVIIPLVVFAGLVFLVSLGYLKARRFFGRMFGRALPANEGRENVRVRLPGEIPE
jgi:Flp pilus assembly protein TadB